jgi:hypothetical protein
MLWVGMGHRLLLMVMVWVWVQIRRKMLDSDGKTTSIQELGIKCERELPFASLLDFAVQPTIDANKSSRLLKPKSYVPMGL